MAKKDELMCWVDDLDRRIEPHRNQGDGALKATAKALKEIRAERKK